LILGATLFGIGWAMSGLCPGTFYTIIPMNNITVLVYWGIPCLGGIKVGEVGKFLGNKVVRGKG
jgi:uncharacterized membrane protein YedE/YeeE